MDFLFHKIEWDINLFFDGRVCTKWYQMVAWIGSNRVPGKYILISFAILFENKKETIFLA